jgi:hypothetical protein
VDGLGQVLAGQGFEVTFKSLTNPPREIPRAPFRVEVPFPPLTAEFRIKHNATQIGVLPVSSASPSVTVTAPNGGEVWPGSGPATISWTVTDGDSDPLSYAVQYSPDGVNWMMLATNIMTTTYTIDAAQIAGGAQARVQVIATDGIHTATDESDAAFTVGEKLPQAFILAPQDGAFFGAGGALFLEGYAYDLEDGALSDSAFQWSSDLDGELGTGGRILGCLSPGKHTLTMKGMDKTGKITTATTTIDIGYRLFLPTAIR